MRRRKKRKNPPDGFCDWMDGYQDASGADEMPDGAWGAMMQEGVDLYNETEGTHIDSHEGWLYWIEHRD